MIRPKKGNFNFTVCNVSIVKRVEALFLIVAFSGGATRIDRIASDFAVSVAHLNVAAGRKHAKGIRSGGAIVVNFKDISSRI